jgi:predicted Ser/Thr protein kinase
VTTEDSFGDLLRAVARAPDVEPSALADADLVGRTLGHFRVLARLGQGGMGVVYRAEDLHLRRTVALKVLSMRYAGDAEGREGLLREARAAAAVTHPGIAAIYEAGEADGVAFIAMEYVEGETLRALVARGPLAESVAVDYAVQIARGLARAHAAGIVHRDLKPDNVMRAADGALKILDFGLARPIGDPLGGRAQGTPAYMAPEQALGRDAGPRADVFSFGVLLHELLTGACRPGAHEGVPRALEPVIKRCMAFDPAARFADATSLLEALERAGAARERRARTWRRVSTFALVTAVAVGAGFALRSRPAPLVPTVALKRLTANVPEIPIVHAALSPDGAELAYIDVTGLTVKGIGSPRSRRIDTPGGASPALVAWFPRGDALLVAVQEESGKKALWRVPFAGGEATRLAEGAYSGISVSPDGARIAFAETDRVSVIAATPGAPRRELVHKANGCFISEIAWAPTSARIAYTSLCFDSLSETAIETVDLEGHPASVIVSDPRLFNDSARGGVVWTPKNEILYPLAEWLPAESGSNLYAVAVDAKTGAARSAPRAITSWVGTSASVLSASAAGGRVAFVRFELQADVFIGDLVDGGRHITTPRRLTLTDRNERPSAWSRDGRGVYFFSDRNGNFDLFFQEINGAPARTIASDDAWETLPQLTPDGASLLYWRFPAVKAGEAVRPDLFRSPRDGGAAVRVLTTNAVSHPAGAGRPQPWEMRFRCPRAPSSACVMSERDGEALVFTTIDPVLGRGAEILRIAKPTAASNLWDVSPDGTRLAIPTANGPVRIYPRAGEPTDVVIAPDCDPLVPAWSADGEGLYVSVECASEPPFRLYYRSLHGESSLVWQDPPNYILEPEPSPDGAHLAIATKRTDNDVWMVELP